MDKIVCGQCFEWAFNNLSDGLILVHATVHNPWNGTAFPHAWLESKSRVKDWQSAIQGLGPGKKGWAKDKFYAAYKPININKYSLIEAQIKAIKSGHSGPWK